MNHTLLFPVFPEPRYVLKINLYLKIKQIKHECICHLQSCYQYFIMFKIQLYKLQTSSSWWKQLYVLSTETGISRPYLYDKSSMFQLRWTVIFCSRYETEERHYIFCTFTDTGNVNMKINHKVLKNSHWL